MSFLSALGGLVGGFLSQKAAKKAAKKEYQRQKEFAQEGIQWRVEDAKQAGVHPLYAIGAQTTSYSPQSVGGADWGSALSNMGASFDDIANKRQTAGSRVVSAKMDALSLERASLENDLLRVQIRKAVSPGLPPAAVGSDIVAPVINKGIQFSDPQFGQKIEDAWGESPMSWIMGSLQGAKDIDRSISWSDVWDAVKPRLYFKKSAGRPVGASGGFPRFGRR